MVLLIADDEALIHKSIEYCVRELPEGSDLEIRHAYNGVELLRELNRRDVCRGGYSNAGNDRIGGLGRSPKTAAEHDDLYHDRVQRI